MRFTTPPSTPLTCAVYTLIVSDDQNNVVLYKQLSDGLTCSVGYTIHTAYLRLVLLHNQWIGLDEKMEVSVNGITQFTHSDPCSKKRRKTKKEKNQEEIDLLNFISWEEEVQPSLPAKSTDEDINLDSFLNSLFE